MNISQTALAWLYLYAWLLGLGLGAFYDLFRITRVFLGVHYSRRAASRLQSIRLPYLRPWRKREESRLLGIVVFLEDLLFCIIAGISLVLLFYEANDGKFRFLALLCAAAGFLTYRGTLGRLVMMFSEIIAFAIDAAIRYAAFFIALPFRMLYRLIRRRAALLARRVTFTQRKKKRRRFTASENGRTLTDACGLIPKGQTVERKLKRGKQIVKRKEKAIQSVALDARAARHARRGVDRRVCK